MHKYLYIANNNSSVRNVLQKYVRCGGAVPCWGMFCKSTSDVAVLFPTGVSDNILIIFTLPTKKSSEPYFAINNIGGSKAPRKDFETNFIGSFFVRLNFINTK